MIFNVSGGGGTALNFRVVGNPKPTNPKENCIWVDTDTPITSYTFNATQPTGVPGMVWIFTGISSTVAFNALKKNGIQVYPISAKQYIGGAWVDKTAKSWQNEKWIDWWDGTLFDNGDQVEAVTGGWWKNSNLNIQNSYLNTGTVNVSNVITVGGGTNNSGIATTKNKIDFSRFEKLFVTIEEATQYTDISVHTAESGAIGTIGIAFTTANSAGTFDLNVSKVAVPCYISIGAAGNRSSKISKVWLE